jgi:hypothetical protein
VGVVDEVGGFEGVVDVEGVPLLGGAVVEPAVLPGIVEPFEPEVALAELCPRL